MTTLEKKLIPLKSLDNDSNIKLIIYKDTSYVVRSNNKDVLRYDIIVDEQVMITGLLYNKTEIECIKIIIKTCFINAIVNSIIPIYCKICNNIIHKPKSKIKPICENCTTLIEENNYSYVYLINQLNSNAYKIGMSDDPTKRLSKLQACNPNKLQLINAIRLETRFEALKKEQELHKLFEKYRHINEWFIFDDNIINVVLNEFK